MNKMQHAAWFAAGLGLGIASTWLVASPRGRRARRNVAHMMEQRRGDVQKAAKEARNRGMEMVNSGKEFLKDTGAEIGKRMRVATI